LGHRIGLAVGAQKRRHQQGAAQQAFGVAQGRDRGVHRRAGGGEGRQLGRDHHRGHVLGVQGGVAGIDAKALEHRLQALAGEGRVVEGVARTGQAHHDAVADQHVLTHAFEIDDVFDSRLGEARLGAQADGGEGGNDGESTGPK
jgi:hypothetical protein